MLTLTGKSKKLFAVILMTIITQLRGRDMEVYSDNHSTHLHSTSKK